jgi:MoxR-like ATPase
VREEERAARSGAAPDAPATIPQDAVFAARAETAALHVADAIDDYVVALVCATRRAAGLDADLGRWIEVGSSPRASIALDRAARAHAWLAGQPHVTPENVRAVAPDVLRHRLILTYEANADRVSPDAVLERLVPLVAVGRRTHRALTIRPDPAAASCARLLLPAPAAGSQPALRPARQPCAWSRPRLRGDPRLSPWR